MSAVKRVLLLVVTAVSVALSVASASASAAVATSLPASRLVAAPDIPTGRDCLNPPMPANPMSGFAYSQDPGPAKPVAGDPFAKGAKATMYDRYGYAGLNLGVFDQPNKLDICQPIVFDRDLNAANSWTGITLGVVAFTVRLARLVADGTFGQVWDPVQQTLLATVGGKLFLAGIGFTVAAGAVVIVWRKARSGNVADTASWVGKVAVIVVIATACMFSAVSVGATVDKGIALGFKSASEVAAQTSGRDAADAAGITIVDNVLFPAWQHSTFGGDQKAVDEFSERLWKAGTFTREEQAEINRDPASATTKIEDRQAQYKVVMGELKAKYPQAYASAAGIENSGKAWEQLTAMVAAFATVWFLAACLMLMLYGAAITRVAVGLFPAIAVPAVFPKMHGMAAGVGMMVVAAVWRAIVASLGFFAFVTAGVGNIMRSGLPILAKIFAILIVSVLMFKIMKQFGGVPSFRMPSLGRGGRGRRGDDGDGDEGKASDGKSSSNPADQWGSSSASDSPAPAEARMRPNRRPSIAEAKVPDLGPLESASSAGPARHAPAASVAGRVGTLKAVGGGQTVGKAAGKAATLKTTATVAGRATPVLGTAIVAGSVVKDARNKARPQQVAGGSSRRVATSRPDMLHGSGRPVSVGPASARRALPSSIRDTTTRSVHPRARTYADATRRAPFTSVPAKTGSAPSSVRVPSTTTPASAAVVRGVVVAGGRGIHTMPSPSQKPARRETT